MTDKRDQFVKEYLLDFNATQAAIRSGYKASGARSAGSRLLAHPYVAEEVRKARAVIEARPSRGNFTCLNCVFVEVSLMQCRVGRPRHGADGSAVWPRVDADDWCAEGDWGSVSAENAQKKDDF